MFWGLPFQSRQHRGFQGGGTARSMDSARRPGMRLALLCDLSGLSCLPFTLTVNGKIGRNNIFLTGCFLTGVRLATVEHHLEHESTFNP